MGLPVFFRTDVLKRTGFKRSEAVPFPELLDVRFSGPGVVALRFKLRLGPIVFFLPAYQKICLIRS
jgi:hypothetical protein